ncbi:MAG: hypothetical protein E4H01_02930 [Lysobacterales bacterium]|nr:MAG: hypothetical protein E4H01_02930 [Xanthomonadales bacterium]
MKSFLDTIDLMSVPNNRVAFGPCDVRFEWDVDRHNHGQTGVRYRCGVNVGAQIVLKGNEECGLAKRQVRRLLAKEIYKGADEIKKHLIEMQVELYNVPDDRAQRMATDLNFLLIAIDEMTT